MYPKCRMFEPGFLLCISARSSAAAGLLVQPRVCQLQGQPVFEHSLQGGPKHHSGVTYALVTLVALGHSLRGVAVCIGRSWECFKHIPKFGMRSALFEHNTTPARCLTVAAAWDLVVLSIQRSVLFVQRHYFMSAVGLRVVE